ncbi:S9 family peptidase [Alteromonas aestuariivivens]|uniref:S9 family peptidase n=1 Tax=Alteromonas aestuariivivens TaxID=1938339 RepID=A0A3D8MB37_9ALTE|nr:prolyl oligopeptidase family serine peptidase [Alteromonas aestuariivivens]RDV27594.1 S9 family peptidase [Alteromonas aestuariivivens]
MKKISTFVATVGLVTGLSACVSTTEAPATGPAPQTSGTYQQVGPTVVQPVPDQSVSPSGIITLEKIMSDPDWLGRQPQSPGWSLDGSALVYERKLPGSPVKAVYAAKVTAPQSASEVSLSEQHLYRFDEKVTSAEGSLIAFRVEDSVFVQFQDGSVAQITRGGEPLKHLRFMTDNRLMAQQGNRIIAINLQSGHRQQLVSWQFKKKPEAVSEPKDYIAGEQISLIEYIAKQRRDKQAIADHEQALAKASPAAAPDPVYFNEGDQLVAVTVSPKGDKAIFVTSKDVAWRDDSDIMPHYIQEDGRIASKKVRRRVADAESVNHDVWYVDLVSGKKSPLSFVSLPGYNEDVLAEVKAENAKAKGETYQINRLPRDIMLMEGGYWGEPSIRWHANGEQVALMLEAWDNKDRWIATVDFDRKTLVNQHRLHDDAWVNYYFNEFGWLNQSEKLYFLSEHSGYSHLYVQTPGQAPRAMTSGQYVVSDPTLTSDDRYAYFKANKKHPGIYEIYRVDLHSGQHEALTDLNGMTDYVLSPDEQNLLLTHSTVSRPPELYLQAAESGASAQQITDTVSDEFLALPWTAPQVVAIPSSYTAQPIYARVYLPEDYLQGEPRRAVVFNHGAGYLQNSHLGWSGYFREYMFHSMLAQQGYVVLDMDYRASAGYGRDWRTAIYRQMGTPEVQDLREGIEWLVSNANVDRERIGTYGGSYGGFLTFMSMFTAPELFQAGAALRPVTDWAHYNTGYTSNILNTPDVDPIAFERSSPIYFAEGLEKPLLINAPMVDDNVFFLDTVRLVQRLIELEKTDFETAIYPVEPHGFVQPSSWLDEYRRIYKLFESNL